MCIRDRFYIVVTNFSSMVKTAEECVAVTVFFNEGTTEDLSLIHI